MKTAIVTGGSRGIGEGIVRMLAGRGYRVIASYAHNDEAARQLEQQLQHVRLIKADHSDRRQTYAFIEEVKRLTEAVHCVVCNAGITLRNAFTETTDEQWDAMMEVAVNAHVILLRQLYPLIQPASRILFTGSTMGLHPHATVLGYGVTKGAVHALVRNLVKEFEPLQTTVNAVAPGFVETDWHKNKPEHIRAAICAKTAAHRFATVEEAIQAYAFCLDNPYVNGAVIEVNGGYDFK
ncbi:MAG: SDR family oxidoreductase [Prevotella sp.]|nr:SDR family oxidoreductase [Prevotella sp.]